MRQKLPCTVAMGPVNRALLSRLSPISHRVSLCVCVCLRGRGVKIISENTALKNLLLLFTVTMMSLKIAYMYMFLPPPPFMFPPPHSYPHPRILSCSYPHILIPTPVYFHVPTPTEAATVWYTVYLFPCVTSHLPHKKHVEIMFILEQ